MEAALEVLRFRAQGGFSVAVLGDMLELGAASPTLHRALGQQVVAAGVDLLFTYGREAEQIAFGALSVGMAEQAVFCFSQGEEQALACAICQRLPVGAVALFKASGKMKMGEILQAVKERLL